MTADFAIEPVKRTLDAGWGLAIRWSKWHDLNSFLYLHFNDNF